MHKVGKTDGFRRADGKPGHELSRPLATPCATPENSSSSFASVQYPRPNLPRLYFSGRFYSDPPTINNAVYYYDINKFRPTFQLPTDEINDNGFWNPNGTGTFAFVECRVDATYSPNESHGIPVNTPETHVKDPLVGRHIEYNDKSVYGKIVDLDPQFQDVFSVYGAHVNIGEDGPDSFSSLLLPTTSRNWWEGVYNPDKHGRAYNQGVSAVFQGLLKVETFQFSKSGFLKECAPYLEKSASFFRKDNSNGETKEDAENSEEKYAKYGGALSIRFRLDWFCNDSRSKDFCYGNISAYITPWLPEYPETFDADRRLYTTLYSNGTGDGWKTTTALANIAYARIEKMIPKGGTTDDEYSLFVDLVNSLYRLAPEGRFDEDKLWHAPFQDQGLLEIGYYETAYDCSTPRADFISLGEIHYKTEKFERNSSVVDLPISTEQFNAIQSKQLALRATRSGMSTTRLCEAKDGLFTSADHFLFRLQGASNSADEKPQCAQIYCSQWGRLLQGQTILIGLDSTSMQNDSHKHGLGPKVGVPESAIKVNGKKPINGKPDEFMTSIITNERGFASLNITGLDCGNPRKYIDGQLYGLRYTGGSELQLPDKDILANEKLNILLFNVFNGPKNTKPSWLLDIFPIFKQYANLYPSMSRVVRLDDYGSVQDRKQALKRVFVANENSAEYMPVKRDLSKKKRDMIVEWLDETVYMNDTIDDVRAALQTAIELEHATMPPYLTALFSIKPGYNSYVANTLRGVVMEEMLHMALACNILIAIGGSPVIDKMAFVPKYPGPLPGGLCDGLVIHLRKCSKKQMRVFEAIEKPKSQHLTEDGMFSSETPSQKNRHTIAWLYEKVLRTLKKMEGNNEIVFPDSLPESEKMKNLKKQVVTEEFGKSLFKITKISEAERAIKDILIQGEGSSENKPVTEAINPDTGLPELAHYFKFAEIARGRRLLIDQDGNFSFNGPKIEIDMDGVYNMQDDPKIELQPVGSQQRDRMESFARKYRGLLTGLHKTFNGQPEHLKKCFGLMFQLTMAAQPLMEMPALNENGSVREDGTTCGVSFQMPLGDRLVPIKK